MSKNEQKISQTKVIEKETTKIIYSANIPIILILLSILIISIFTYMFSEWKIIPYSHSHFYDWLINLTLYWIYLIGIGFILANILILVNQWSDRSQRIFPIFIFIYIIVNVLWVAYVFNDFWSHIKNWNLSYTIEEKDNSKKDLKEIYWKTPLNNTWSYNEITYYYRIYNNKTKSYDKINLQYKIKENEFSKKIVEDMNNIWEKIIQALNNNKISICWSDICFQRDLDNKPTINFKLLDDDTNKLLCSDTLNNIVILKWIIYWDVKSSESEAYLNNLVLFDKNKCDIYKEDNIWKSYRVELSFQDWEKIYKNHTIAYFNKPDTIENWYLEVPFDKLIYPIEFLDK